MSKKIMNLNSKEFKNELIDFFIYTKELTEEFYKKNNIKYIDYYDFIKNHNIDDKYLFLSNLHKDAGSSYIIYEKYPDFKKDFTDTFYLDKEKLKKRKKMYQDFLNFLKKFLKENPSEAFFQDYNIDKKDFKYFRYNLVERFFDNYHHSSRILEPLFYFYLKENNILNEHISYFEKPDIKIFKIFSIINPIPYYYNINNFYNFITIGNIYYSEILNFTSNSKFLNFQKLNFNYLNDKLNYLLYDYKQALKYQSKYTFIINLDNYILQKFKENKNIEFIRKNRVSGLTNLLTFDKLKNYAKELGSNFEEFDLDKINKWI